MSKYDKITKGMTTVDLAPDVDGYNYFGMIRTNGEWVIMREKTDLTEYRVAIGGSGYSAKWVNKTTINYGLPIIE